jgi:hypothetical protein
MKQLILLLSLTFISAPAQSQHVTEFDECTRSREVYVPGYYDRYGNYQQGYVNVERYNVSCGRRTSSSRSYCDPTRTILGGILGGGIAASMSRGDGYRWSVPVGAFIGGASFGCN